MSKSIQTDDDNAAKEWIRALNANIARNAQNQSLNRPLSDQKGTSQPFPVLFAEPDYEIHLTDAEKKALRELEKRIGLKAALAHIINQPKAKYKRKYLMYWAGTPIILNACSNQGGEIVFEVDD